MGELEDAQAKRIVELENANKALADAVTKLTTEPGPEHIDVTDVNSPCVDLKAVSEGRIILDRKQPEKVEPKEGEIHRNDPNLSKHIDAIAAGKLRIVG